METDVVDSVLEQIRQLEQQKASLIDGARDEAMAQVASGIEVLGELGFHYEVVPESQKKRAGTRSVSRKPRADKDCPICGFQTDPPHDARHHKGQEIKAPFTDQELEARGYKRVHKDAEATDISADVSPSDHTVLEPAQEAAHQDHL